MKSFLVTALLFTCSYMQATELYYHISIAKPHTHYATVDITVTNTTEKFLDFKLPVWTPGSYMIREFARNVEQFKAVDGNGKELSFTKTDKNTWRVTNVAKNTTIKAIYELYANEPSVRTSVIDADHAFLHNTSVFMLVDQYKTLPGKVKLDFPDTWKKVATGLESSGSNEYRFADYDILADSPIEIGNHETLTFEVMGVPHTVALVGVNNCPKEQFTKDLKKICETMANIVGEHPCKSYTFIIQHVEEGGGGLEHLNSNCVQMPRYNYSKPDKYLDFLGLCGHEYFHLWNVKRIRPEALGPFNYNQENYTHLLWVAEGITSYYDELALYRAGFWTKEQYLGALAAAINGVENRPGSKIQPLADASWDAWIKEYRPNENSANTNISYYSKGSVVAALLDIEIAASTNGQKHLDDLLKYLYQEYYKKQQRGFSDEEFTKAASLVAGKDMKPFMDALIFSAAPVDYKQYFDKISLSLTDQNEGKQKVYLGAATEIKDNKLFVKSVEKGSPAFNDGLCAGDELIALNGNRVKVSLDDLMRDLKTGDVIKILVSRSGLIRELSITLRQSPAKNYSIKTTGDSTVQDVWLKQ